MIFIGDVHGHFEAFNILLERFPEEICIQVGDLGVGFPKKKDPFIPKNTFFIRGNHDSPQVARTYANYLGDFGYKIIDDKKVFYVSGAWSIDANKRTEGIDFWSDEELTIAQLQNAIDLYEEIKPDIVVTHDCPTEVGEALLNRYHIPGTNPRPKYKTRTDQALQAMFEIYQPKHWIFGHYHTDWTQIINGTEFNCLNELSWCKLK